MLTLNITSFINKKQYIYSIGDIQLPQPIAVSTFFIAIAGFVLYSIPMYLLVGLEKGFFSVAIILLPPLLVSIFATRPIFGEKNFLEVFSSLMTYWGEPRGWYDLKATDARDEIYYPYIEVLVSRNRELQLLADLVEGKITEEAIRELSEDSGSRKRPKEKVGAI